MRVKSRPGTAAARPRSVPSGNRGRSRDRPNPESQPSQGLLRCGFRIRQLAELARHRTTAASGPTGSWRLRMSLSGRPACTGAGPYRDAWCAPTLRLRAPRAPGPLCHLCRHLGLGCGCGGVKHLFRGLCEICGPGHKSCHLGRTALFRGRLLGRCCHCVRVGQSFYLLLFRFPHKT